MTCLHTFQAEIESLSQNLEQTEQQLNKVQREASQLDSQLQEAQVNFVDLNFVQFEIW